MGAPFTQLLLRRGANVCAALVDLISSSTAHRAARLPMGVVPRGTFLEAAHGGGKTTLLGLVHLLVKEHNRRYHREQEAHSGAGGKYGGCLASTALDSVELARRMQSLRADSLCTSNSTAAVVGQCRFPADLPRVTLLALSGLDASIEQAANDEDVKRDGTGENKSPA